MWTSWIESPTVIAAFLASLVAGVATGVGALPLLLVRTLSDRAQAALMGFSAGVMLAASFLSLLLPALETVGSLRASLGLVLGAVVLGLLNRYAPHEHFLKGHEGGVTSERLGRTWLFVIAITLHNIPEGLAVGVGVGSGEAAVGLPVTIGIALQNMPEGLVVAVSLLREGYARGTALAVALGTGLVEPLSAVPAYAAVTLAAGLLPWALAFAAGAMIYVVSDEIIPESHRGEAANAATAGTIAGFVLMVMLDGLFGG